VVFEAVSRILRPSDVFSFSVEELERTNDDLVQDWKLLSSGRFAHSESYIRRLVEKSELSLLKVEKITPR
jgi:predicted TPR repeat methyltransferase